MQSLVLFKMKQKTGRIICVKCFYWVKLKFIVASPPLQQSVLILSQYSVHTAKL